MRSDHLRIYKSVHTWTGLISGMALFIAFYAGALTVFKEPLTRWASPPVADRQVSLAEAPALIQQVLETHPAAARDFSIELSAPGATSPTQGQLSWQIQDKTQDDHDTSGTRHYTATLDRGGQAKVQEDPPSPVGQFIDVLHRVVGLPVDSDPNRWFMGTIAALYAVALISGVVVLLPTLVKDFFALRVGRNIKRMWLDAHNVVGIISLPFHIIMALTAVIFAFHDPIYGIQDALIHEGARSAARAPAAQANAPRDIRQMIPPQQLLDIATGLSPSFQPHSLQYLQTSTSRASVRVWGRDERAVAPRARGGFVVIDPYNGRIISDEFMPGRQNTANLWISSFFALHMAAFGGATVSWLYFLLGLAGAWLFYSGNLLWIESRRKRALRNAPQPPQQRRDVRLMASATVGICLGCVCGVSLMLGGSRWLHDLVEPQHLLDWHQKLYYGAFFCALGWSFVIGAGRASVHLLWCAAALTLAIPLGTLLAWLQPDTLPWTVHPAQTWAIEATALAGAIGLAVMARATARRLHQSGADSVWSTQRNGADITAGPDLSPSPENRHP